ncbi:MAG: tetratricopeptide repeat protein [Nitrospirota bacterium]
MPKVITPSAQPCSRLRTRQWLDRDTARPAAAEATGIIIPKTIIARIANTLGTCTKTLDERSSSIRSLNYVQGMFMENPNNNPRVEACKRAIQLNPDDADTHRNLGEVYVEFGRYRETVSRWRGDNKLST